MTGTEENPAEAGDVPNHGLVGSEGADAAAGEAAGWRESVQRTDEIELLISAAAFFGLMQAPTRMTRWWSDWTSHQSVSDLQFATMLMQIGYGVVFVLLASFLIHLVLRGFWIGLIGLRSVFPQGIDWARLARAAPITTEYQSARMPRIESTIVRVDRLASVVFISASLLVGMTLAGALLIVPVFIVGGVQVEWLFVLLFLIFAPVTLQFLLDRVLAARSPRWAAKPWIRRTVLASAAVSSRMMPRILWTPMLTLQSRLPQVAFGSGTMLLMLIVLLAFPLHLFGERRSESSNEYALIDEAILRHGMSQSAAPRVDKSLEWAPRLDRVQVAGAWVELFVPFRPASDAADLAAGCPGYATNFSSGAMDAERADTLRNCVAGLWRVTLDGAPVDRAEFVLARKGDQRGVIAMLPTAPLGVGRHQLVVTPVRSQARQSRRREPQRARSLMFWVSRDPRADAGM